MSERRECNVGHTSSGYRQQGTRSKVTGHSYVLTLQWIGQNVSWSQAWRLQQDVSIGLHGDEGNSLSNVDKRKWD